MTKKKGVLFFVMSFIVAIFLNSLQCSPASFFLGEGGASQYVGKHDIKESPYYKVFDFYNMMSTDSLILLNKFPTRQQNTFYTCGPAAAGMVVKYYLQKNLHSEKEIARMMGTNSKNGTDLSGMISYFQELGWNVESTKNGETPNDYTEFLSFVEKNLRNNTPIIVENIEWGGHWRVIIGYDTLKTSYTSDDVLIMADSFDTTDHVQDGYCIVSAQRFFYEWFDAKLYRDGEKDRLWLTANPKR